MPVALSLPMRQLIVEEKKRGKTLRSIAGEHHLSYTTVCRLVARYQREGQEGLVPHYERCGGRSAYPVLIHRAAVWLKRLHPGWGASLIRVLLLERYAVALATERTLQRWFLKAGLAKVKSHWPPRSRARVKNVHDCWQVDAKEKLRLRDGRPCCYLTLVDQKGGSLLAGFVFPPRPFQ